MGRSKINIIGLETFSHGDESLQSLILCGLRFCNLELDVDALGKHLFDLAFLDASTFQQVGTVRIEIEEEARPGCTGA